MQFAPAASIVDEADAAARDGRPRPRAARPGPSARATVVAAATASRPPSHERRRDRQREQRLEPPRRLLVAQAADVARGEERHDQREQREHGRQVAGGGRDRAGRRCGSSTLRDLLGDAVGERAQQRRRTDPAPTSHASSDGSLRAQRGLGGRAEQRRPRRDDRRAAAARSSRRRGGGRWRPSTAATPRPRQRRTGRARPGRRRSPGRTCSTQPIGVAQRSQPTPWPRSAAIRRNTATASTPAGERLRSRAGSARSGTRARRAPRTASAGATIPAATRGPARRSCRPGASPTASSATAISRPQRRALEREGARARPPPLRRGRSRRPGSARSGPRPPRRAARAPRRTRAQAEVRIASMPTTRNSA